MQNVVMKGEKMYKLKKNRIFPWRAIVSHKGKILFFFITTCRLKTSFKN